METEVAPDRDEGGDAEGDTTDSILEALLVDDAEVRWDPLTGEPRVKLRRKSDLDSAAGSE